MQDQEGAEKPQEWMIKRDNYCLLRVADSFFNLVYIINNALMEQK